MTTTLDPLIRDFVAWVNGGRPYSEVVDAWRTSCPRLTVWEDAAERGFVERVWRAETGTLIVATERGRGFVEATNEASASL